MAPFFLLFVAVFFCIIASRAGTAPVSFTRELAPVLMKKCVVCHGGQKPKGAYRLDTIEMSMKPGDSKALPIVPGQPEHSLLYKLITHASASVRMPQDDEPLPRATMELFARWIREGARFDGADPRAPLVLLIPRPPHPTPPAVYKQPVPVLALALHPRGDEMATGGYYEINVWSFDGKLKRRIRNVAQMVHALDYSPDGSLLAAACGTPGQLGEVSLVDLASADNTVRSLATLRDSALDVKFSPDGTRLAACGADNTIRRFEVATRKEVLRFEPHADWVHAIAWSPDGTSLASASRDRTARVFDAKTGAQESVYAGHAGPVFAIAYSSDGRRIISGGRDKALHVWEARDAGKPEQIGGFDGDFRRLLVSAEGVFASTSNGRLHQCDLTTKKLAREFDCGERATALALLPGKLLIAGTHHGEVRMWSLHQAKRVARFIAAPGHQSPPTPVRSAKTRR